MCIPILSLMMTLWRVTLVVRKTWWRIVADEDQDELRHSANTISSHQKQSPDPCQDSVPSLQQTDGTQLNISATNCCCSRSHFCNDGVTKNVVNSPAKLLSFNCRWCQVHERCGRVAGVHLSLCWHVSIHHQDNVRKNAYPWLTRGHGLGRVDTWSQHTASCS